MKDFFISYNHTDTQWATWIAGTLEEAGYTTTIQAWDFPPGVNFGAEMHKAAIECARTIAVLSKAYLASLYTLAEWSVAFVHDPSGMGRKLVPVRVEPCEPTGQLRAIVHCDLVGLDGATAKQKLVSEVRLGRHKPAEQIIFPGNDSTAYPGPSSTTQTRGLSEEARAIKKLLEILRTSYKTFVAQCRVRDEVFEAMRKRLEIDEHMEYERFFSRYYKRMDDEERHLHSIIRSYTANILSEYNARALQILEEHPDLLEQVKLLPQLKEHLTIWLGKYKGVLQASESACLIYVGVEEEVPFPKGVEDNLEAYLQTILPKEVKN